ncbi:MAG: HD domain-containing protein [Candidatus Hydrogenedentes bacterium]|nr:HD domain-containing protein [Candidatus Hydrogenedentota bacterium]
MNDAPRAAANGSATAGRLSDAMSSLVSHLLEREEAVSDLAEALMTGYEELNLLYNLLPNIATHVDAAEIGQVLVEETARTLRCRRVSLMVLDDTGKEYRILASCGLPPEAQNATIPVAQSIASQTMGNRDMLVVDDIAAYPELQEKSPGTYESPSFAIVRVPLQARGEALGLLAATERIDGPEFTAHDRKLLEGLSAMGASALLNCKLHASVNKQMMSTIHALASAVDAKDQYTHDHAGRVANLCLATARELDITDNAVCRDVQLSALLHDIGKIGIPDAILLKPASLTPDEFAVIRNHTKIGAGIVQHVPGLEGVTKAILHHHERFDGLGYPAGLSGDAIPIASALIAVADAFDALTSDRPYRAACETQVALDELDRHKGTQFNPRVVDAFTRVILREGGRCDSDRPNLTEKEPAMVTLPRASET